MANCREHDVYYPDNSSCPLCGLEEELRKCMTVIEMMLTHYEGLDEINCPGFVLEARKLQRA